MIEMENILTLKAKADGKNGVMFYSQPPLWETFSLPHCFPAFMEGMN